VQGLLLATGSFGLIVAMATDALAVLGRHTGFAVNGAIEIFQVSAVIALSSAIVLATITERHASVDLLANRLPAHAQHWLAVLGRLAAIFAFLVLAIGSAWVSFDLWPTREMTEQLAIPLRMFRLFWLVCCTGALLYSVLALVREVRR
jgi:TRAP-type C4-dicarboxylate transport system permease small subunit